MAYFNLPNEYLIYFIFICPLKYSRLITNLIAYWTYRPVQVAEVPLLTSKDVTVILPSLEGDGEELARTIRSCLSNNPAQLILVTIVSNYKKAFNLANSISQEVKVMSTPIANKRTQLCHALPYVKTKITVFADDDVTWPEKFLSWVLAPFIDSNIGGVGTNQRHRRVSNFNIWNFLGTAYLIRRNFDIISCNHIDGGLSCISGRTVAYRTSIVQDPDFIYGFTTETWINFQLNADDDNFLTRWLMNNNWDIKIQAHRECELETTLEGNSKFLLQCMRWSRSNWRSNLTSLFIELTIWRRYPWSTFAVFQTTLSSWSLIYDAVVLWLWWRVCSTSQIHPVLTGFVYLWVVLLCRIVKYIEHFCRYPADLIYMPIIPLFGWYHSIGIKLHAMFTLKVTTWGSREGADEDDNHRLVRLPSYLASFADKHSVSDDFGATTECGALPAYSAKPQGL